MGALFRRILVPFDFSAQARQALGAALDLASEHQGEVLVLCALEPISSLAGIRPPGGPLWVPPDDLVAAERERLADVVTRVRGPRRVAVRSNVVVGAPLEVILVAAKRADLIVMATTGRGALSHLLVGSVAEKVVRHATVPVLTIGKVAAKRIGSARRRSPRAA